MGRPLYALILMLRISQFPRASFQSCQTAAYIQILQFCKTNFADYQQNAYFCRHYISIMILYNSPLIRLDYTPATDILTADLSATYEFYALEVQEALSTIAKYIRHYDVKRLLMDSRKRIVQIENERYTIIMSEFMQELQSTRLQKLARLNTGNTDRENLAKAMQAHINAAFQMKTFADKEQALEWLKSN